MRPRLLRLLRCPDCLQAFAPEAFRAQGEAILEGSLACPGCGTTYPIIGGIPRILPDALMGKVWAHHQEFFRRYRAEFAPPRSVADSTSDLSRTLSSFSFQWNTFGQMYDRWEANFRDYVQPLTPEFFAGKTGLDAGCGFGRHAHWASRYGAEIVGMDLSEAVEAAARNNCEIPTVHIVQGDIYHPPFAPETFDFCYSIGVIHHLPDPPLGFRSLTTLIAPGGHMFVWIYGPRGGPSERVTVLLRRWTTSMDYRRLHALCWTIALGLRLFAHVPYRILSRFAATRPIAGRLPFHGYHDFPLHAVAGDAFDRLSVPLVRYYTGAQVRHWFEEAGLDEIQVHRRLLHNESWRVLGVKTPGDIQVRRADGAGRLLHE